ncbi:MAG: hypothetical protein CVU50_00270 [Candidatus Cloacimonetes bacterium HGW-Cloacimonetes-3]|jgi:hypothetical protein|nr:MAG: hypothetical protein CVU50_00270 [Candidatus Cloacimonetes bacterium HGW-Cloacimonetes-3]
MPETVKPKAVPEPKKSSAKAVQDTNTKISLVELILILMLVGLVFVFFFGMKQLKIDKANEAIAKTKFEAVAPTFQKIIAAMESYRKNDEFGDYPAFLEEMNLGTVNTEDFKFEYVFDTLTLTATSQPSFGKAGVKVNYNIGDKSYTVEDPAPEKKPTVKDEWLPQE